MTSRRSRKTDRGVKDFGELLDAIKSIKIEPKTSIRKAAASIGIPFQSLSRYVSKFDEQVPDITAVPDNDLLAIVRQIASYKNVGTAQMVKFEHKLIVLVNFISNISDCKYYCSFLSFYQVFDENQEKGLEIYLIKCANLYYGLSIFDMRQVAYHYAVRANIPVHESWIREEMAGWQWYYGFMKRHQNFSLRSPEQTSLHRVKAFCQPNVTHFFRNLDTVISNFTASSIWNMDETGFSTVPTKMGKVISLKGMKRVGKITSAERGSMITLAFAVSASGNTLPPFYLYPKIRTDKHFLDLASSETVAIANGSGWMTSKEFVEWMKHFIKYSRASLNTPVLLLLDNHASHLNEAVDLASQNGVTMVTFPPHCSHRMQPLDVTVFGPVKGAYNKAHDAWMKINSGKPMDINIIPSLAKTGIERGATPANIISGFKCTGICPYDPEIFQDSDSHALGVDEQNREAVAIEHQLDADEIRRIVVLNDDEVDIGANETVASTSQTDASTSETTSNLSRVSSYVSMLDEIGPVQLGAAKKKSNRGRKPGKSTILTSPENMAELKEKQHKRQAAEEKKVANAAKRKQKNTPEKAAKGKKSSSAPKKKTTSAKRNKRGASSQEDASEITCEGCGGEVNAAEEVLYTCSGTGCRRVAHEGRVTLKYSMWSCEHCDSDDDM